MSLRGTENSSRVPALRTTASSVVTPSSAHSLCAIPAIGGEKRKPRRASSGTSGHAGSGVCMEILYSEFSSLVRPRQWTLLTPLGAAGRTQLDRIVAKNREVAANQEQRTGGTLQSELNARIESADF